MKKVKSRKRVSKRKAVPNTVDEYLAGIPEPARSTLNQIRAAIRSAVPPEAVEIISYRIPAFKYGEVLMWYAAFSDHCSLFPTRSVIETLKKELAAYSISKGTVHFPADKPMSTPLVRRLVKARVAEVEAKKQSRSRNHSKPA
jgi:uncharacterized protein YdhG (YjbR/CyaY superfamily)